MVEKNKGAIALQQYDYTKMFYKEALIDVMNEAYKSNVKGKLYRLTYELNKDTRIRVRTAVGDSDPRMSYENVTQGSLDAAILSSNGLAKGTEDFFQSSECEVVYGNVELSAQIFMDDIFCMAEDVKSAQYANNVLEEMVGRKSLKLNTDKSSYIIMGNKKARKGFISQLKNSPLSLYN